MQDKYYDKSVADGEEFNELSDYDSNIYDGEVNKELLEDDKNGVIIIKPIEDHDYYILCDWLENTSHIARETTDGYFILYEDRTLIEKLEHDLYQTFDKLGINVTIN